MVKPLDGIKVVEITSVVAGPTAGWILATLGAEVTLIESLTSLERKMLAGAPGYFVAMNRHKRSIAIDLKALAGKQILYKLARQGDVLLENMGPGAMDRLGFSYEELKEVNPRLIYASIKGFGSGPSENKPGYDMAIQAEIGLMYMTGSEDRPMRMGTSAIDMNCATFLCLGIVLALRERDSTQRGQYVRSDLFETGYFLTNYIMAQTQVLGTLPPPLNTPGIWFPIYDIFTTKDNKRVLVGVSTDSQLTRFCDELDLRELLDERFSTREKRMKERSYFMPLVTRRFLSFSREELIEKLEGCRVTCTRVNTPLEALENPQLKAPNKTCQISYPTLKEPIKAPTVPLSMGDFVPPTTATAPQLGEQTDEILYELGYTEDEIELLVRNGTVTRFKKRG